MSRAAIALVTGADEGIGFATARLLAELGMVVHVGSRAIESGAAAVEDLVRRGLDARLLLLDVTDDDSVARAARRIESDFGHLDVLVNGAGALVLRDALEVGPDDMRAELETNVVGMVRVVHAMLPLLRRSEAPRVVNVSSDSASFASTTQEGSIASASHGSFVFSAAKAAVNMLTVKYARAFADDPGLRHVRINAVTPGCGTDPDRKQGARTSAEGAWAIVRWATVADDGTSGGFFDERGRVAW